MKKKLHNEKLYNLCSSSHMMRWAEYVARIERWEMHTKF